MPKYIPNNAGTIFKYDTQKLVYANKDFAGW